MGKDIEKSIAKARKHHTKPDHIVDEYDTGLAVIAEKFREIDKKIHAQIVKDASTPLQLSWLPTKTTRSSFFAPIPKKNLNERYTAVIFKSSWGTVTVEGPPLNIADESVFLALLYFINKNRENQLKINYKAICDLLGVSYQTKNRRRIKGSIKKLSKTSLDYEMKDGSWSVKRLLNDAFGLKDLAVVAVDHWFFERYLINEITTLDMNFRRSLKGDITKALYRFLNSHRGGQSYNISTLVLALNIDPNQALKEHRRALKAAFTQLKTKKFLTYKFKDDTFYKIKVF